jgi:hypothetical protein
MSVPFPTRLDMLKEIIYTKTTNEMPLNYTSLIPSTLGMDNLSAADYELIISNKENNTQIIDTMYVYPIRLRFLGQEKIRTSGYDCIEMSITQLDGPMQMMLPSTYLIMNCDVDNEMHMVYNKLQNDLNPVPFINSKFCNNVHNPHIYKSKCSRCNCNGANIYNSVCKHGGFCVVCYLQNRSCIACNNENGHLRRIVLNRFDDIQVINNVCQPCGHISSVTNRCEKCQDTPLFVDTLLFVDEDSSDSEDSNGEE